MEHIILLPSDIRSFETNVIVVAWDATSSAVRAVYDALPLLIRARDVAVLSVIDDKAFSTPYSGEALCHYLTRWGVNAKFNAINCKNLTVATALLSYAERLRANLLVMGGVAHGFARTLMLGIATQDVFRMDCKIPIFLSH